VASEPVELKALVLVGGEGTRLRPLTYDVPKPMLPIVERPMIARIVEWLGGYGVTDAVFSLGYRPDAFLGAFPDGTWAGVRLHYAIEPERLDTAGAILFGAMSAGLGDETFLVVNGDILTDLDLDELIATHRRAGGEATIALTPVEDPSAYGVVATNREGRVLAFIEKPPRDQAPTNLVNAGTYVLEPAALERIAPGRRVSIEREVFPALVEDGALFAMASDAYWLDTGTPERYLKAQDDVLSGARPDVVFPECVEEEPGVRLAPGAVLEGVARSAVFLGCGSLVEHGAEIGGAVIGAGGVVEPGALVSGSVLLPGVVVRTGARVLHSVVGPGAVIGDGACVSRFSVLGARVVVEAGAVLDSARVSV
jgi:mannose-1-phosphate guanylyltransferase